MAIVFPSPCGVKKLKRLLRKSLKGHTESVSVPLRGKKIETFIRSIDLGKVLFVSVPLRGKKIETQLSNRFGTTGTTFPSPCGVKKLKPSASGGLT